MIFLLNIELKQIINIIFFHLKKKQHLLKN
jgi:hypothetical protein